MPRQATFNSPIRANLSQDEKRKAIRRFENLIAQFEVFDPEIIEDQTHPKITEIAAAARSALENTYPPGTTQHSHFRSLTSIEYAIPMYANRKTPGHEVRDAMRRIKLNSVVLLRQAISDLKEDLGEQDFEIRQPVILYAPTPREAFIVHGHDEGPREAVARYLEKLKIKPIILHEQPNKGRTLIEKFEQHGNVPFAVVLLTPDDVGGINAQALAPRARQNVILELGYFIAKLGRARVCALKKGDVEQPSDVVGVAYVDHDEGGAWRHELAREIEAAGIDIDWNTVMKA